MLAIDPQHEFLFRELKSIPKEIVLHILEYAYHDAVLELAKKYKKESKYVSSYFCNTQFTKPIQKSSDNVVVRSFGQQRGVLHTNFATTISLDFVEYFDLSIGGWVMDTVYVDTFEALYVLYDIPRKNKNGNSIIPFYLSKIGVVSLRYHTIRIEPHYHDYDNYQILYETDQTPCEDNEPCKYLIYQSQHQRYSVNDNLIYFNLIVFYILVEDPEHTVNKLELRIQGDDFVFYRNAVYGNQSAFKLIDIDHAQGGDPNRHISFHHFSNIRVLSKLKSPTRITAINSQTFRTESGMAGLTFSH